MTDAELIEKMALDMYPAITMSVGETIAEKHINMVREHDNQGAMSATVTEPLPEPNEPFHSPCQIHKNVELFIVPNVPNNNCFGCYMNAVKTNERAKVKAECKEAIRKMHDECGGLSLHYALKALEEV